MSQFTAAITGPELVAEGVHRCGHCFRLCCQGGYPLSSSCELRVGVSAGGVVHVTSTVNEIKRLSTKTGPKEHNHTTTQLLLAVQQHNCCWQYRNTTAVDNSLTPLELQTDGLCCVVPVAWLLVAQCDLPSRTDASRRQAHHQRRYKAIQHRARIGCFDTM